MSDWNKHGEGGQKTGISMVRVGQVTGISMVRVGRVTGISVVRVGRVTRCEHATTALSFAKYY